MDVERVGERRTLRSIARPQEELNESKFFREFRRRLGRYGLTLKRSPGEAIEALSHSMRHPAAFQATDVQAAVKGQLNAFVQGVVDRVLDDQTLLEFTSVIIKETEAALVNVLEKA